MKLCLQKNQNKYNLHIHNTNQLLVFLQQKVVARSIYIYYNNSREFIYSYKEELITLHVIIVFHMDGWVNNKEVRIFFE